jgi:DNA-binding NtrC family response regulator
VRNASILVVDDDRCSLDFMRLALSGEFAQVRTATGGIEALLALEASVPDLVITDLRMPDMDGLELLQLVKERWPEVPLILVTVEQEIATVVEAVQRGATNYLTKPVSPSSLCSIAVRALATTCASKTTADRSVPEILGSSRCMVRARHLVCLAARSDVNVLITGETGTGKELVARAIHRLSSLARGPFIAHNCAVSPQDLFESQFFGHRRGAFTGADRDHRGLLEQADGGVLFLDELECLSLQHQGKLLRFLDDGRIQPVGAEQDRLVAVRILSATNREPERMLADGSLREDLYYRLRGFEIRLPPLRGRRQDIARLAEHFLSGTGKVLTPEALETLQGFHWPGNVRHLRNVLLSGRSMADGGTLDRRHLSIEPASGDHPGNQGSWHPTVGNEGHPLPPVGAGPGTHRSLRDLEREALMEALRAAQGHRGQAARNLGIHRSTLRRKLRDFGS